MRSFKKNWPLIGGSVTKEVLEALNMDIIPNGWNEMAIVIIYISYKAKSH
jgi:hypothetical protein